MTSLLPSLPGRSSAVAFTAICVATTASAQSAQGRQPVRREASAGTLTHVTAAADGPSAVEVRTRKSATPSRKSSPPAREVASRAGADRARIAEALREYQLSGVARPVTRGMGTVYPFGHGTPLLTCAVLRVCVVELERGEAIVDEPLAGDQARWIIQTARAGPGGRDALVVVKPKACDLATNLVIPTDRRIYDLSLESVPCGAPATRGMVAVLTRRVAFYYPDDLSMAATVGALGTGGSVGDDTLANHVVASREPRNDRYRVVRARRDPFGLFGRKPVDFPWTPRAIVDDGERVYVVAPPEARRHGAPVLYALEDDGSRTIINVAVRGDTLVSDRTFRRGVLVLAAGNREQRLTFENRAWGTRASRDAVQTSSGPDSIRGPRASGGGGR